MRAHHLFILDHFVVQLLSVTHSFLFQCCDLRPYREHCFGHILLHFQLLIGTDYEVVLVYPEVFFESLLLGHGHLCFMKDALEDVIPFVTLLLSLIHLLDELLDLGDEFIHAFAHLFLRHLQGLVDSAF